MSLSIYQRHEFLSQTSIIHVVDIIRILGKFQYDDQQLAKTRESLNLGL